MNPKKGYVPKRFNSPVCHLTPEKSLTCEYAKRMPCQGAITRFSISAITRFSICSCSWDRRLSRLPTTVIEATWQIGSQWDMILRGLVLASLKNSRNTASKALAIPGLYYGISLLATYWRQKRGVLRCQQTVERS